MGEHKNATEVPENTTVPHPGVPSSSIEEEALAANAKANASRDEKPKSELGQNQVLIGESGPVKALNDRRRKLSHHGKNSF